MKMWIRWAYNITPQTRDAIRARFGIPRYTTLNGLSPADISEADMALFEETSRRGFFGIMRHIKWRKNGDVYVCTNRQ